jgi:hypothetical protein
MISQFSAWVKFASGLSLEPHTGRARRLDGEAEMHSTSQVTIQEALMVREGVALAKKLIAAFSKEIIV